MLMRAPKFAAVLETAALNDEYCRKRGLFPAQITAWRSSRRMTGTVRARRVLARRPEDQGSGTRACAQRPSIGGNCRLLVLRKKDQRSGGTERTHDQHPRSPNRHCLINEAITGARRAKACAALEISDRTLWTKGGQVRPDGPLVPRPAANKLKAERAAVLEACNSKEFSSLPPSQIVPNLADQGLYLAESSFYRILRADGQPSPRPCQCGANHPPAIRPALPVRFGLGT